MILQNRWSCNALFNHKSEECKHISASLFCARIERKNVRISLIMKESGVQVFRKAQSVRIRRYVMEWVEKLNQSINYIEEHFNRRN